MDQLEDVTCLRPCRGGAGWWRIWPSGRYLGKAATIWPPYACLSLGDVL